MLTALYLTADAPELVVWLVIRARGLEALRLDVTGELQIMVTGMLCFWVLGSLIHAVAGAAWRRSIRKHMQQVALLAQEARRLGAEEARRTARPLQMDVLEEAISDFKAIVRAESCKVKQD